ncbi:conjugal transfer protein MobC [Arachidicoccus terrestris]|uniref:conjugal transfer protein MobC n=1 Tax=Arachidicoccus terrestris TaxID=2875539 RepID=UPI001CC53C8A|nr:conjugal transfer protein MobC [Arachidicoccus terrestris]UAY55671.1 YWFCY domain-containing protein [Arachidicoccus terrestris]
MKTGENEQGLKQAMDLTRGIAIVILIIHFYYECYKAFSVWGLTFPITDRLLGNIVHMPFFAGFLETKLIALGFLLLSLLGVSGKKSEKIRLKKALKYFFVGILLYLSSGWILCYCWWEFRKLAISYIVVTGLGFIFIINGGSLLSRLIKGRLNGAVFNKDSETFPQEERLLMNEFSINLPAKYNLKGKERHSWINIHPVRGFLLIGSPGSGKSYFVIEHAIRQHLSKGFSMLVYDYKYDALTKLAYNQFLKNSDKYANCPSFYVINLNNPGYSHRCNPITPIMMEDITDAIEAARVILLGLNKSWLKKQGEFFVESPINFLTALIWFLRKFENGRYCTLPHVIEFMQVEIESLFTILQIEPEISAFINPFVSAFKTDSKEQLEGQLDAAKISMARLSAPNMYYVLSGNDFTLDINNPLVPKIVCMANNPQKQETFAPVLSLFMTRLSKIMNQPGKLKSSLIIDEFTTLTFLGLDTLIATGRSNKISTTLAIQDASQLRLNYGREQADVVLNICGNIMVGQAAGDVAKQVSERIGKILQEKESVSFNDNGMSISRSKNLDYAVPVSTIATLSSGEFVGIVADTPEVPIELKAFHSKVQNDHKQLSKEASKFKNVPKIRDITLEEIEKVYKKIKADVFYVVDSVTEEIMNDPGLHHLILRKESKD